MPSITFVDFMFVAAAGFCFFSLSDACPHSHNQITTPGGRYSSEAIFSLLSLFPLLPDVLEAGDRQREREYQAGGTDGLCSGLYDQRAHFWHF